jgi:hypothetical protein
MAVFLLLLRPRRRRRLHDDVEVLARAEDALPGYLDLSPCMLGALHRLLRVVHDLIGLPNRELRTLEGANRRFEGFGKR